MATPATSGATSSGTCTEPTTTLFYSNLPTCTNTTSCLSARCTCLGLTLPSGWSNCNGTMTCSTADFNDCYRTYYNCLNTNAQSATTGDSTSCDGWGGPIQTASALFIAQANTSNATAYSATDLFAACAYDMCLSANASITDGVSACPTLSFGFACMKPVGAPPPPTVPIPPVPPALPNVPRIVVAVTCQFPGNFTSFFALSDNDRQSVCDTFGEAIRARIGGPAGTTICTSGSLVVNFQALVPAAQATVADNIQANAAAINDDTDTTWLAAPQASLTAACTTCSVTLQSPAVNTAVAPLATPAPGPPSVEQDCGSGCIAGVIIGVAVVVIVVLSVACFLAGKSSAKGDAASREPIEMENKV